MTNEGPTELIPALWRGSLLIQLVTPWRYSPVGWLPDLLSVLESEPRMVPHNFRTVSLKTIPYERAALLSKFEAAVTGGKAFDFVARRTRDVPYELRVWRTYHWHVDVAFDSDSARNEDDLGLIFAMADKLAVAARADVGTLYPESFAPVENPVGRKYKTKTAHLPLHGAGQEEFGLTRLGARSFLSARVTELIGRDLVASSGCPSVMLERGILRVDLTERPYSLNRSELEQAMARASETLAPSEVFPATVQVGKPPHSRIVPLQPGARWVPLPGVRAKKEPVAASSYGSLAEVGAATRSASLPSRHRAYLLGELAPRSL